MKYLVTAIGSLSASAVIASLRRQPASRIVGTNCYPAPWTAEASSMDAYFEVPRAREATAFIDRILGICRSEGVSHVIPLTDPEIDVLTLHRERFSPLGVILCMPSHAATRICRDKWLAYEAFRADGRIRTIPTWRMDDVPDPAMSFPAIAKPRMGRSSEGLIRLEDASDLRHYRNKLAGRHYIVQPYLEGAVCVVDVVRQRATGRCASMSRRELTRTANGAGLAVQMLSDARLDEAARRIVEALDINGCINIEFLAQADASLLMDINPRFSAGVAFSKLSGYDMVANHVRCFGGPPIEAAAVPPPSIYTRRFVEAGAGGAPADG